MSNRKINLPKLSNSPQMREYTEIGKCLKAVDRTLFTTWSQKCEGIFTVNIAQILWDCFPPIACDIHTPSYSQARESFLKLLRPGVNYEETFEMFAEKMAKRKGNQIGNYDYMEEEQKGQIRNEISLNKNHMIDLLRQLGITMKEVELRSLIDCFDTNGDGVITLNEFLSFIGPKRDKRSGISTIISQKCCWNTT